MKEPGPAPHSKIGQYLYIQSVNPAIGASSLLESDIRTKGVVPGGDEFFEGVELLDLSFEVVEVGELHGGGEVVGGLGEDGEDVERGGEVVTFDCS